MPCSSDGREIRGGPLIIFKSGNCERSVEILPDLNNYPINNSPSMNPSNGSITIVAFDKDSGPKGVNALRNELEKVVVRVGSAS